MLDYTQVSSRLSQLSFNLIRAFCISDGDFLNDLIYTTSSGKTSDWPAHLYARQTGNKN